MNHIQVTLSSIGKRVLCATRDGYSHLKQALGSLRSAEPADDEAVDAEEFEVKEHLREKGISTQLLRISVLAISLKALHYCVERKWLHTVASVIDYSLAAPFWIWAALISLTSVFVPLVCSLAMAVITWYTVFLDSCIPGVYPPSPKSLKKNWFSAPSTFHLGYIIALVNGFVLSLLMYQGYNNPL